ncbi:UDP-2,3-diacylglucosamine diphosphatase [Niveibacterium umoris]|uniref:UDP-2,3-diacylglucosamine hydrolase n=1 Tax=Niveibacterium umoris TaxID=1193620 RepID=A0A840BEZ5_9RHOO|nr:UDP-2,3-diacylglucosamine diphosphatase [Niveibacterium umoris]MBB4012101.1 UDP-2,3-diacylglucosamine hydrolase [Niveibacterium umoris]
MIHFISDLHLTPKRPEIGAAFARYLNGPARGIDALYVLGDLFDAWPGDDALAEPAAQAVANGLAALAASGTRIYLLHGNRDFLIDKAFAQRASATLIDEPYAITLGTEPCTLMHGDALCTDDVAYQRFRTMVRNPDWRSAFLAKPLAERLAIAADVRMQSEQAKQEKSAEIMDVNPEAVAESFRANGYATLIHGHTHRPARHTHLVDGRECTRWVLHDWREHAEWLEWSDTSGLAFGRC